MNTAVKIFKTFSITSMTSWRSHNTKEKKELTESPATIVDYGFIEKLHDVNIDSCHSGFHCIGGENGFIELG